MKRIPLFFLGLILIQSCGSDSSDSTETPLSSDNFITSFVITKETFSLEATVGSNSVTGSVPSTIALTDISLEVKISNEAQISPNPSTVTSLLEPVVFTITAEDGTKREYTVNISRELSAENRITAFILTKDEFSFEPEIGDNSIVGTVPSNIELEDITLEVAISEYASIEPDPSTISSISDVFTFVVTAENGSQKEYQIDISRELSNENELVSFKIISGSDVIDAEVDDTGTISKRLPQFFDLANLNYEIEISKYATIDPDPAEVSDFSSEVVFAITSESGSVRNYTVSFELMDTDFEIRCDNFNVSKWFGGDARDDVDLPYGPFDRNVGTGQTLTLTDDSSPESFGVLMTSGFVYRESGGPYTEDVELELNIRDSDGSIKYTTTTVVLGSFKGGWVYFNLSDLDIFLEAQETYIFTWHLINGGALGITSGSYGDSNEGLDACNGSGYSGQSRVSFDQNLEDWDLWSEHPWHFNFRISGKN